MDIALKAICVAVASLASVHDGRAIGTSVRSSTTIFEVETRLAGNASVFVTAVQATINHTFATNIGVGSGGSVIEEISIFAVSAFSGGSAFGAELHGDGAKGTCVGSRGSDLSQE